MNTMSLGSSPIVRRGQMEVPRQQLLVGALCARQFPRCNRCEVVAWLGVHEAPSRHARREYVGLCCRRLLDRPVVSADYGRDSRGLWPGRRALTLCSREQDARRRVLPDGRRHRRQPRRCRRGHGARAPLRTDSALHRGRALPARIGRRVRAVLPAARAWTGSHRHRHRAQGVAHDRATGRARRRPPAPRPVPALRRRTLHAGPGRQVACAAIGRATTPAGSPAPGCSAAASTRSAVPA